MERAVTARMNLMVHVFGLMSSGVVMNSKKAKRKMTNDTCRNYVLLQVRKCTLLPSNLEKKGQPHISCECILIERIAEATKFHSPL